jgi:uncharacterized protein YndB with AHSA1/START domain
VTDRIEREIQIDAPIERVFALVSEPGWWIEDGPQRSVTREGDLTVVELPAHGMSFPVLSLTQDPPRYACFRSAYPGMEPVEGTSTLVEFTLTEQDGGTLLRVVESGYDALTVPCDTTRNVEGWERELRAAKQRSERVRA